MKINRATKHQEIWKRTENGLELVLPKNIKTDIGFQLIFGYREDKRTEQKRLQENDDRYFTRTYLNIEDFKKYL